MRVLSKVLRREGWRRPKITKFRYAYKRKVARDTPPRKTLRGKRQMNARSNEKIRRKIRMNVVIYSFCLIQFVRFRRGENQYIR